MLDTGVEPVVIAILVSKYEDLNCNIAESYQTYQSLTYPPGCSAAGGAGGAGGAP